MSQKDDVCSALEKWEWICLDLTLKATGHNAEISYVLWKFKDKHWIVDNNNSNNCNFPSATCAKINIAHCYWILYNLFLFSCLASYEVRHFFPPIFFSITDTEVNPPFQIIIWLKPWGALAQALGMLTAARAGACEQRELSILQGCIRALEPAPGTLEHPKITKNVSPAGDAEEVWAGWGDGSDDGEAGTPFPTQATRISAWPPGFHNLHASILQLQRGNNNTSSPFPASSSVFWHRANTRRLDLSWNLSVLLTC